MPYEVAGEGSQHRARVLLVGVGPTAEGALAALAGPFAVVALVRDAEAADPAVRLAAAHGVPVHRDTAPAAVEALVDGLAPDAVVVSSYDRILPAGMLARCPFVNVHYAPLPRYRGRAAVNWAVLNGEPSTAITIHALVPDLDAGGILAQEAVPIGPRDTVTDLYARLDERQRALLAGAVTRRLAGDEGTPQIAGDASYGCTRIPADGEVDWSQPTAAIDRLVRALTTPYPGAFTYLGLARLWLRAAEPAPGPLRWDGRVPGRIVGRSAGDGWVDVLTGDGVLRLLEVQDDGPVLPAAAVIRSVKATLGLRTIDLLERLRALEAVRT